MSDSALEGVIEAMAVERRQHGVVFRGARLGCTCRWQSAADEESERLNEQKWHVEECVLAAALAYCEPETCPECKGKRQLVEWFTNRSGMKSPTYGPCHECDGTGSISGRPVLAVRAEVEASYQHMKGLMEAALAHSDEDRAALAAVRAEVEGEYEQVGWTEAHWYPDDTPDDEFRFLLTNQREAPHSDALPVYRHRLNGEPT